MSKPLTIVKSLDHLVLTCASIPATISWYSRHLGMKAETFTPPSDPTIKRHALRFGAQKINLHQQGKEFEPKAKTALPGTADLCFLVSEHSKLEDLVQGLQKERVEVLEGAKVVSRTGAHGQLRSIYVRDPDGNLVDIPIDIGSHGNRKDEDFGKMDNANARPAGYGTRVAEQARYLNLMAARLKGRVEV